MTNYFLMSLAVADLLVCMIVMPFGAIVFFKGQFLDFVLQMSLDFQFSRNNISLSKLSFKCNV